MTCPRCGLPDNYNGQGDGIGSCECSRCDCCGAGPDDCDCRRDWDERWPSGVYEDDDDEPFDALCNDTACPTRQGRLARAAVNARAVAVEGLASAEAVSDAG